MAKYSVYVIEHDKSVLQVPKFRKKNPDYNPRKPCVYVGQTVLTPKERFQKHLAGERANRFVRDYDVRLKPRLYGRYNPMSTRAEAVEKEEPLAKTPILPTDKIDRTIGKRIGVAELSGEE